MTTAHRPTWKAAVGKAQEGGWSAGGAASTSRSALDAAAHTKLKLRSKVIDKKAALRESLLKLEEAEAKAAPPKRTIVPATEEEGRQKLLKQTAEVDEVKIKSKYDDADDGDGDGGSDSDGWDDIDRGGPDDNSDLDASDSDSESSDDEDDEEALQAELAKIRAEREAVKAAAEAEAAAEEAERLEEAALLGNPLLSTGAATTSGKMKRRWNDDVVFRNQAKGEPEIKKRFINDTVRNDFHKRFLNKFVR